MWLCGCEYVCDEDVCVSDCPSACLYASGSPLSVTVVIFVNDP